MAATQLLTTPVLRSVDVILDAEDGAKFDMHLTFRALAPTGVVEVDITVPDLPLNTWDPEWWDGNLDLKMADAVTAWDYLLPA